jgi:hypothetical protein
MVEQTMIPRKIRGGDQEQSEDFFWICRLKEKARWLPSVMHFEGRLASGPEEICNMFAEFIQRMMSVCLLILAQNRSRAFCRI